MGKWTYLKNKLPPLPDPSPKHKDLVEEAKKRMQAKFQNTGQFLLRYVELRNLKDENEIARAALQIEVDACEDIIKERFENEGIHKSTLQTGETISTSPEPHAVVEDQEAMVKWAKENDLEKSLTLPWSTLNSQLKLLLEKGQDAMPGVKPYIRTKVLFRRNDE